MSATERDFELAGGPYAATAARLALDNLDAELDPVLAQDLRLLVTEAVKNSVQHADVGPEDSIGLKISLGPERGAHRGERRGSRLRARRQPPDEDEVSGWGLFLIDQLADRWGVVHDKGTTVWFEVAARTTETASPPPRKRRGDGYSETAEAVTGSSIGPGISSSAGGTSTPIDRHPALQRPVGETVDLGGVVVVAHEVARVLGTRWHEHVARRRARARRACAGSAPCSEARARRRPPGT